jgi:cystathionine gamma-synthase
MDSLRHFPLGTRFPDSPHAVISSLPTMEDVRGYEEHDPRVLAALKSGYPRFVVHVFVQKLVEFYQQREGLVGQAMVLVDGRRAADDAVVFLGAGVRERFVDEGVYLLHCDDTDKGLVQRLKKFVQHTGCGVYSRQAEDLLLKHGLLIERFVESVVPERALAQVEQVLARQISCRVEDVLLCASGMNAFYAAFRAVRELQRSRGRTHWIQLGWLYIDSGCILKEFLGDGEILEYCYDVNDTDTLIDKIASLGDSLAAVVVECPTNPLVRVCDLKRVSQVVRDGGGVLIVDPTVASIYNVNVLPYADILVNSLTKYASNEGDVMIGSLALNAKSPYYGDLAARVSGFYVPPYYRDLQRLAFEMQDAPEVVARVNRNAARLAELLRQHPAVDRVYYTTDSAHYAEIAKDISSTGAVVSIVLKGSMERFYDKITTMKGPSFGTRFTLLSPFMYLAHYDLVTQVLGRAFLRDVGIDPDLIRISVGVEPYEAIAAVFEEALEASVVM